MGLPLTTILGAAAYPAVATTGICFFLWGPARLSYKRWALLDSFGVPPHICDPIVVPHIDSALARSSQPIAGLFSSTNKHLLSLMINESVGQNRLGTGPVVALLVI